MTSITMTARNRFRDRLVLFALVGAILLTVTWWTVLAYGLWFAIG